MRTDEYVDDMPETVKRPVAFFMGVCPGVNRHCRVRLTGENPVGPHPFSCETNAYAENAGAYSAPVSNLRHSLAVSRKDLSMPPLWGYFF